mmetsp:Transcript_9531/g.15268  ORF Transcript_9531/g.15268 Transcript_9531/m.15268 type:complete len:823 (-) Transcript_9531:123-2591(-)
MAYQYGAVVSAGGQEAEALMPPYRSSSGDRTNTPGMWRSFLMVALALVVGALCGGLEAITEKSSSTTLGSAPLLNRDPNAGNQATGNQTAGNQTAALGFVSLGCPQSSTVKVKLSVHDALRAVGMSTTVVGIDIPNKGFSYNIKVPEIHGHGICTLIEMAESFEALIKERDLESVVKVIPGIGPAVDMLKELVDDAKDLVQTAPKKLSKIKEIALGITDIPGTLENVAELVFESMFPINAGALTKIINDEFQSLLTTASLESSLGHDASSHDHPSTRNFLGNDERTVRSAVRAKIRATLRGDGKTVNTTVHHQMPPAALGDLSLGNICFKAPEINKALKLLESKELSYAMPWPVKLANDAFKPADFKLPVMKSETCIKLSFEGGLVDHKVAMDLIKVFLDFFKPIIFKGLQAVMDEIMGDAESILALVEPVINVVGHVEDGYDKVTGIFSKRKLLSDEDNDDDASRRSDALKNVLEERLLHKSMELRRALIADPFMENNFMETHLPGVDVDRPIAELGGAFKNAIASKARGRFDTALQGMKNTKFEVSFTQTFEMDILIKLPHGGFQTGDLIHLMVEPKPCPLFKFRKDIPISPPLMGSLQIAGDFQIPYFFKSDVSGEFRYTVKVDLELKVTVSGSDLPTVEFKEPIVEVTKNSGFQHGKTSLQVGAKAIINKFFVGLCVGPVCTGPFAKATQALYVGFDAFTGDRTGGISGNSCVNKAVVKNKLQTAFVDWEYPDGVCTLDGTDSGTGFGAYLNIPKTQASVTMSTFDASPWAKNSGLNFVWHDFNVQKQIGEGDWHMKELFPPQCTSDLLNGGVSISRG